MTPRQRAERAAATCRGSLFAGPLADAIEAEILGAVREAMGRRDVPGAPLDERELEVIEAAMEGMGRDQSTRDVLVDALVKWGQQLVAQVRYLEALGDAVAAGEADQFVKGRERGLREALDAAAGQPGSIANDIRKRIVKLGERGKET